MSVYAEIDRKWSDYPIGTKAHAVIGGYWVKTIRGWQWLNGKTFPTPGGDAIGVSFPLSEEEPTICGLKFKIDDTMPDDEIILVNPENPVWKSTRINLKE